jgi:hypothetical protein
LGVDGEDRKCDLVAMAVTFQLVERTPYTLRYLATSDGQGGTGTIPHATLSADAATAGEPIRFLVDEAAGSQAVARQLFNGDGLTTGGSDANLQTRLRGRLTVMARNTVGGWAVDANASAGFAVIDVIGPINAVAYIELHARHSLER